MTNIPDDSIPPKNKLTGRDFWAKFNKELQKRGVKTPTKFIDKPFADNEVRVSFLPKIEVSKKDKLRDNPKL
ncbi:MAG TPA: hypothetical protein VFX17_03475 [Patescibacteria group bacterium]|nr:hypothetical protein [Patescibacteria group bacterium]